MTVRGVSGLVTVCWICLEPIKIAPCARIRPMFNNSRRRGFIQEGGGGGHTALQERTGQWQINRKKKRCLHFWGSMHTDVTVLHELLDVNDYV